MSTPELVSRWRLIGATTGLSAVATTHCSSRYRFRTSSPPSWRLCSARSSAIAVALYAVNFATFPEPPGESAVDLGPLLGLWYAAVSALLLRRSVLESSPEVGD